LADPLIIELAQHIATRILEGTGVDLEWYKLGRSCPGERHPILIHVDTATPSDLLPSALASSQPYEGVHIRVFYDRLCRTIPHPVLPSLLGYVLAHEIGHILQGGDWHAASGVMKKRWDENDHFQMLLGRLSFTDNDILMIHLGLDARAARARAQGGDGALAKTPVH
jgi:hypothetical protein